MDHNNWYGSAGTWSGTAPTVTNETNVAPDFRNPTAFDFDLNDTSPLIDLGISSAVSGYLPPTDDKDGAARIAPNDIGAYEFCECGDDVLQAALGEECDDGNRFDGDGCDANCLIEPGYVFHGDFHATDGYCDCVYTVDNTGAKSLISNFASTIMTPTSMAVHPDGDVYITDNATSSLYSVDPVTGATALQCSGLPTIHGLAVNPVDVPADPALGQPGDIWPRGTVFGSRTNLYVIDPQTCSFTDIGAIGSKNEVIAGLDFDSDGMLYGGQLSAPGQTESLFTIDTVTGQGTFVGTIGPADFDRVGALLFDGNDVLWVSDISTATPQLVRLDLRDGSIIKKVLLDPFMAGQPLWPQGLGLFRDYTQTVNQ